MKERRAQRFGYLAHFFFWLIEARAQKVYFVAALCLPTFHVFLASRRISNNQKQGARNRSCGCGERRSGTAAPEDQRNN